MYTEPNQNDQGQPRADRQKIESHLEELFVENLEKYISPAAEIIPQFSVQTSAGNFRLDFVVELQGKKTGFECDGKEFLDGFRDEWRDGFMLESGQVDTIYRFRGKDLYVMVEDCIFYIFKHDPFIFNDRYKYLFNRLVSPETLQHFEFFSESSTYREQDLIPFGVIDEFGEKVGELNYLCTRRSSSQDGHWKTLMNFGKEHPGKKLDQLLSIYKAHHDKR